MLLSGTLELATAEGGLLTYERRGDDHMSYLLSTAHNNHSGYGKAGKPLCRVLLSTFLGRGD